MKITIQISTLKLIDRTSFVNQVIEKSTETATYKEAYEAVEKIYTETFKKRRFSSYESFKVAKHREQNQPKKNQLSLF